jgi:putative cell wall-binding protein
VPVPLRRSTALCAVLGLVMALLAAAAPAASASTSTAAIELRLTELVNGSRAQHGLAPLRLDVRLVGPARTWSAEMARTGRMGHDPNQHRSHPPGVTHWAENVGYTAAPDAADDLHRRWMASSGHRANILNGTYTELGVGVAASGGRTWATQRFTAGAPASVAPAVGGLAAGAEQLFGSGGARHAVIVRDDVFADALAAGPLAGRDGPLLLTPPGAVLHPRVRVALDRVLPRGGTAWIVGGTGAVSAAVERELAEAGWQVRRISGEHRIRTAARVARTVVARDGSPATVAVATAGDWPDAIAAGAWGARHGRPVLLVEHDAIPGDTAGFLRDFAPRGIAALGGDAVISDRVVRDLGAVRVAGATRQDTSAAAAEQLWGHRDASATTWIAAPAFDADAWTWALGAAPLAARTGAAVLLVGPELTDGTRGYLAGLGYGDGRTAELRLAGPVPASGADAVRSLLR